MRLHLLRTAGAAAALSALAACTADRIASPSPSRSPHLARSEDQIESVTFDWHAGDAFLASLNPSFAPDAATAANGHTITIAGTGTLRDLDDDALRGEASDEGEVSGGGWFRHTDAQGALVASGTWTARQLRSFVSFGPSPVPGVPPSFHAGRAVIDVRLHPAGASRGIDAILTIDCKLPGVAVPAGVTEGITLTVPGVIDFNRKTRGATLFVLK